MNEKIKCSYRKFGDTYLKCDVVEQLKAQHKKEIEQLQQTRKEIFDKFDKYACIKNDKWYLEFKDKILMGERK